MTDFDPNRPLTMAKFKTVDGFPVGAGTPLFIVEAPAKSGEVTEPMAKRLWAKGTAVYSDDFRPTPVETEEQAKAREAADVIAAATPEGDEPGLTDATDILAPDDLVTWQADDEGTGKKAGAPVTRADLIVIAERESVTIESDDNKPAIIRKIVEHRAAQAG